WGMTLSAAFFAGIHHSGFVFWPVFILGIALAYLYDKRNSLIAPIVLHITHNTLFIAYFFLIKQIISR
ncbi:MAG TPA: CPBP family intramembrane metalloprotease, partial [Candidatus Omnitrophota bacterium]|nr:CPBP family intramembrane metalloprotease [Candidatus Omnitrophota bacterium]